MHGVCRVLDHHRLRASQLPGVGRSREGRAIALEPLRDIVTQDYVLVTEIDGKVYELADS
jgi:hypothetical protein